MRSPQNYGSGLHFPCMSPDMSPARHLTCLIHTLYSPNILTTKTLLGHTCDVSCLGLWTKLTWLQQFLSSEHFYPCCQKILQSKFIRRSGKLSPSTKPRGCHNQAARSISPGKDRVPSFRMECNIPDEPPDCWK
jgi:hypothetical protein